MQRWNFLPEPILSLLSISQKWEQDSLLCFLEFRACVPTVQELLLGRETVTHPTESYTTRSHLGIEWIMAVGFDPTSHPYHTKPYRTVPYRTSPHRTISIQGYGVCLDCCFNTTGCEQSRTVASILTGLGVNRHDSLLQCESTLALN